MDQTMEERLLGYISSLKDLNKKLEEQLATTQEALDAVLMGEMETEVNDGSISGNED